MVSQRETGRAGWRNKIDEEAAAAGAVLAVTYSEVKNARLLRRSEILVVASLVQSVKLLNCLVSPELPIQLHVTACAYLQLLGVVGRALEVLDVLSRLGEFGRDSHFV